MRVFATMVALSLIGTASAADWPMWRADSGRSARTAESLPAELALRWTRQLPAPAPAFRSSRLQFDRVDEPIVVGTSVVVGSARTGSVTALDTTSGEVRWRTYTDGPVRFAPAAWRDRLFVGSDDGQLYCLRAKDGAALWRFRAVPSGRSVLGNGQWISLWPIRGGPVVHDDRVYFAAGVWAFEGVFVYALDAASGDVVWMNDRTGSIYGQQPHRAEGFSGLSPQGYLVVHGSELVVPCGTAYPARFDLATGVLREFALPSQSRLPGGWFAASDSAEAKARRRGELVFDSAVNAEDHEDRPMRGRGSVGAQSTIRVGERTISLRDELPGVDGDVQSLVAGDGKLFAATGDGRIHCLAAGSDRTHRIELERTPLPEPSSAEAARAKSLVAAARSRDGFAFVFGAPAEGFLGALIEESRFRFVVFESDVERADSLRRALEGAGLLGDRVSVVTRPVAETEFPPYAAELAIFGRGLPPAEFDADPWFARILPLLRPYGGTAVFPLRGADPRELAASWNEGGRERYSFTSENQRLLVRREGALPGATDYRGGWSSADERVRAPLGVLWFGDELGHFKRSPQPQFLSGVMVSRPKDWRSKVRRGKGYVLAPATFSDVYTGRILHESEAQEVRAEFAHAVDAPQPSQYRPPTQTDAWKPPPPVAGERVNPLTGKKEPRAFPKSYGCDGGIDYGFVYTMRSATPAYYDKTIESGTINISGPRSGCTNSSVPAAGLLNVPYFYEGCTCSYPLPSGLALVAMPEVHEQWSAWGPSSEGRIERVGFNFGAPGDRVTRDGTLWLDVPSVGGPSPAVDVTLEPALGSDAIGYRYRHATWIEGGRGWPWVAASWAQDVGKATVRGLRPGAYTARLYFTHPPVPTVIDVNVGGVVLEALNLDAETGGRFRSIVKELRDVTADASGTIEVALTARFGIPVLSGLELVAEGLSPGAVPNLRQRDVTQLSSSSVERGQ